MTLLTHLHSLFYSVLILIPSSSSVSTPATSKRPPQFDFKTDPLSTAPPTPSTIHIPSVTIPVVHLPPQGIVIEGLPTPSSSSEEKHLPGLPSATLPDIPPAQPTTIAPTPTQPSNYIYFTVFDSKIPDIDDVQPVTVHAIDPSNLSTTPSHVLLNDVHWKDVHLKDVRLKVPQVEETTVDGTAAKDLASLMMIKPNESHVVMMTNAPHLINSNPPSHRP